MIFALIAVSVIVAAVLVLTSFVQVLYLEAMRLRSRDLPSMRFFKDTLEDRIGLKIEEGAGAYSFLKHSLLLLLGLLYFAGITRGAAWGWQSFLEAAFSA